MIVTPIIMKLVKTNFLVVLFFLIVSNSYAEFKPFTKKQFLDERMKMLSKRFDQIDTNKDGTIDAKENKAWGQKIQKLRQQRIAQLKKADLNKDGQVSPEELKKFREKNKKAK